MSLRFNFKNTGKQILAFMKSCRDPLIEVAIWLWERFDRFMTTAEKLMRSALAMLEDIYWILGLLGALSIWAAIRISHVEDVQFLAATLISIGTSILAICLANLLQKLSSVIPRREWVRKVSIYNDNLVFYLLRYSNCGNIKFETARSRNREFKTSIRKTVFASLDNTRKLEQLMQKRKVSFLLELKIQQLLQIKQMLIVIDEGIEEVARNYSRPMTNREFIRDLANLKSKLRDTVSVFEQLRRKAPNPSFIFITNKKSDLRKVAFREGSQIFMYVDTKYYSQARTNPARFWAVINLIQYLEIFIQFMNFYGYHNNVAISLIKSRSSYMLDKIRPNR